MDVKFPEFSENSTVIKKFIIDSYESSFHNIIRKLDKFDKNFRDMEEIHLELESVNLSQKELNNINIPKPMISNISQNSILHDGDTSMILDMLDDQEKEEKWVKKQENEDEKVKLLKNKMINNITKVMLLVYN